MKKRHRQKFRKNKQAAALDEVAMAAILGVAPSSSNKSTEEPKSSPGADEKWSESEEQDQPTSNYEHMVAKDSVQEYFAKKMAEMNFKLGSSNRHEKEDEDSGDRPSFGMGLGHGIGLGFTPSTLTESEPKEKDEESKETTKEISKEKKDKKKSKKRELAESAVVSEKKAKKAKKSKKSRKESN
jgi:hypothetical protein